MAAIILRPDLRTAGGEVNDILVEGMYAGTLTLVYREGSRVSGSIQLEKPTLDSEHKHDVVQFAQAYVRELCHALEASECDVVVTYSHYDQMISFDGDPSWIYDVDEDVTAEDIDPRDLDSLMMGSTDVEYVEDADDMLLELVLIKEDGHRLQYHIYEEDELLAEVFLSRQERMLNGEIHWRYEPSDDEVDSAIDLVLSDFDDRGIDNVELEILFDGEMVESVHLTHEDLLASEITENGEEDRDNGMEKLDNYTVVLVRDDGDTLTYEIYEPSQGSLPIGTATVDLSRRQLTGFIDFRHSSSEEDYEWIAAALSRELDKEKDYDSLNLTILYNNKPVDELIFEAERIH